MILSNKDIKEINLDQLIDDYLNSGRIEELLVVVPTNRRARQLRKLFIESTPRKTVSLINVETLWTLASKILHKKISYIDLDDAVAKVILNQCFNNSELKFFNKFRHQLPFGTLERIKNYFSKLKENGIYPNEFSLVIQKADESEKLKAGDLLKLYSAFFDKTRSQNILEIGDVFFYLREISASEIAEFFNLEFHSVGKIIFWGFDELRNPEIDFISKISSACKNEIYLKFDYYKYNPKVFGHIIKSFIGLKKSGFKEVVDKSFYVNNELFSHFRQELFRSKNTSRKLKTKNVFRIKAGSRQNEIELIARQIKILILKKNVSPADICVVFNLIENYSDIIRDVFDEYEIPFNLTDRFVLNQSTPVISLINLLEIVENNYHYRSITKAFSGTLISHSVDLNNLLNFSRQSKITSDFNRLINATEFAKGEFNPEEYDFDPDKVLEDLGFIKKLLEPFERKLTIKEFLKYLDYLFADTKMIQNILSLNSLAAEKHIRSLESFFSNIKMMLELEENEAPGRNYSINFFIDTLKGIASHTRYNVKEKSEESVLITTVNEIRGIHFDFLFIGGLCNRDFPTKYSPELIMSKQIASGEISHLMKEKFYFYQAITSWRKNLYLSFPAKDNETELVESNFLIELSEIIEMETISGNNFDKIIFTEKDEYKLLGSVNSDYAAKLPIPMRIDDEDIKMISDKLAVEKIKRTNSENIFAGNLKDAGESENIAGSLLELFSRKEFSVTEMETFSKCPFQYFAKNILKISAEKEPSEKIESIELGNYLHKIFFEFYSELREKGIEMANCDVSTFNLAKEILFKIADKIIPNELKNSDFGFYEIEKVFGLNGNECDSILMRFLEYAREENPDFKPSYFEVGFGNVKYNLTDEILSNTEPVKIDEIKLKGKIDRIDLGIPTDENKIRIVDYKLGGKKPGLNDIKDGIALQLPVYAFVAKSLLLQKFNENYEIDSLKIFSLKYSQKEFGQVDFISEKKSEMNVDDLIKLALDKIKENVNEIKEGKFVLTKLDNYKERTCKFCDFKTVCRIDEII
jgi:ATP-dependent helicase/nuclease subunit B